MKEPCGLDTAFGDGAIYLVSCVSKKLEECVPAKCLYTSPWFLKARACVESTGRPWYILSAKHGLVCPDQRIAPYDETLNKMPAKKRSLWALDVLDELVPRIQEGATVVFLAGERYRKCLVPALQQKGIRVEVPMKGKKIGEQLQWLGRCEVASGCPAGCRPDLPDETKRFYDLLAKLEKRIDGPKVLPCCSGALDWPDRGVYFFFEKSEWRSGSGRGPRVVRVGTHALKQGSKTTLWNRLRQHRGKADLSGGNHRGSIFRLHLGVSLAEQKKCALPPSWGVGGSFGAAVKKLQLSPHEAEEAKRAESPVEAKVSRYIGDMPFLYLNVDDCPSPESDRGFIERNAIALLSEHCRADLDPASIDWLGRSCDRELVRCSGIWNNRHVGESCDPKFLDVMDRWIQKTEPLKSC